ncbi:MAG: Fe-S cluster assembly protein SufD [Acidiferrobacterales bacterium]|nr:Fe-S cluster assembly protein SufD [Acidiferrobacterales bacterium]
MTDIIDHYVDQYIADSARTSASLPDWLCAQKESAISQFKESGFPTLKDEDWRYTSLKSVVSKFFEVKVDETSGSADLSEFLISELDSYRMVFIDGRFSQQHSNLPDAVTGGDITALGSMTTAEFEHAPQALTQDQTTKHGFSALNVAFSSDGYVIQVADNTKLDKPVEILFVSLSENTAALPRNVIQMGNYSQAELIERHVSKNGLSALNNSTCQVDIAEGGKLDYYLVETMSNSATQVTSLNAELAKDSTFSCRTLTLGGGLVRNNLTVSLNQPGAHCDMLGLYSIAGKQHVDNHTNVIHAAPHCTSNELYKGVLDQRSRAVFHGRIKVEQDAQKTDAVQSNNNLLLSANAEIDTKPQLEIYADDVKCAHGATVGQIDETSLFYLRSRGIDETDARSLLTFAFVNDVMEQVEVEALRESLSTELAARLIDENVSLSVS